MELILHQYELSPFSEKLRRILAFKRLAWTAVRAPAVMPKPDLVALTGGYRKIPVLQVGNHVYCDTARIAEVLEALCPEPTLYPSPLARCLAEWADTALFEAASPMIMRPTRFDDLLLWLTPHEQQTMLDDRRALRKDALRLTPEPKTLVANYGVYMGRIEAALATREYLLHDAPCIADFSVYHGAWIVEHVAPERLAHYPNLRAWMARLASLPGPNVKPMTSDDALLVAKNADPSWTPTEAFDDPTGLAIGSRVVVRATDYGREAVTGELVHSNLQEVVVQRDDERAGRVYVHFPRVGFEVVVAGVP